MPDHTPGPWTAYEFGGRWFVSFQNDDSGPAVSIMSWPHQQKANAHLIAAAPEILAALKMAEPFLRRFGSSDEATAVEVALAAIAKAEKLT